MAGHAHLRRSQTGPDDIRPSEVSDAEPALSPDEEAIARSVLFASLFDYPLTLAQLRQTLVGAVQTPSRIVATYEQSDGLQDLIDHRDGMFFPRDRPELPELRRRRDRVSRAFLARHQAFLRLACNMPYVRLVALSGSIAHLNFDGDGDLDLFVVTRGRHAWAVAVGVVMLAKLMGRRRVVCANFVMADTRLDVGPGDLFSASQLLHLRPLIGHEVHQALLDANPFVFRIYPNAHVPPSGHASPRRWLATRLKRAAEVCLAGPAALVELACRSAYRRYLQSRSAQWASPEQVCLDDDRLKLHTRSHRDSVMQRYERTVQQAFDGWRRRRRASPRAMSGGGSRSRG